ncbi:hypothetical protein [Sphingobium phenoxybenzoativorans]|uniref:hypothetical protein n=1 Tax=Sphingobium phenoxybenzoativorans TaxID=1592790 RepID=UPI001495B900|nr:hypothetical protein [Sphingobium phenoxybenzoativorans]
MTKYIVSAAALVGLAACSPSQQADSGNIASEANNSAGMGVVPSGSTDPTGQASISTGEASSQGAISEDQSPTAAGGKTGSNDGSHSDAPKKR